MRLLLDTHALTYLLEGPERMRTEALEAIVDPGNEVVFSAANVWEIEIKAKKGSLVLSVSDTLNAARSLPITEMAISADHARRAGRLPIYHHDPFDRVLIAQAQAEGLTVVTRDRTFALYDIPLLLC